MERLQEFLEQLWFGMGWYSPLLTGDTQIKEGIHLMNNISYIKMLDLLRPFLKNYQISIHIGISFPCFCWKNEIMDASFLIHWWMCQNAKQCFNCQKHFGIIHSILLAANSYPFQSRLSLNHNLKMSTSSPTGFSLKSSQQHGLSSISH